MQRAALLAIRMQRARSNASNAPSPVCKARRPICAGRTRSSAAPTPPARPPPPARPAVCSGAASPAGQAGQGGQDGKSEPVKSWTWNEQTLHVVQRRCHVLIIEDARVTERLGRQKLRDLGALVAGADAQHSQLLRTERFGDTRQHRALLAARPAPASGYGTERLRFRLACNLSYVNKGLGAFVRSRACQSAIARSTAGTGFAPG